MCLHFRLGKAWLFGLTTFGVFFVVSDYFTSAAADLSPPASFRTRLSTNAGESPNEAITALYQDAVGFAWIGTRRGLLRFDGYSYRRFETDVADPNSLADNTVRVIHEDDDGVLWIGTNTAGLARLDQSTWQFEHYRHDPRDQGTISHDSVNVIFEDSTGVFWVGTQIGLNRFDRSTGVFERIPADPSGTRGPGHDYIYSIIEDREGAIWIGTVGGGLDRYDRKTDRFTHHRHDETNSNSLIDDRVFAIAEDSSGYLWVATSAGVARFDRTSGIFETPTVGRGDGERMRNTIVTTALVERIGQKEKVWLGTWGDGVLRVDCETFRVDRGFDTVTATVAPTARIASMMLVNDESLWVGTWESGVKRAPISRPLFEMTGPTIDGGQGGFLDAVSTAVDADSRLWVGTWGEGIRIEDPSTRGFSRLEGVMRGTILSLAPDPSGGFWVGSMDSLMRVDRAGKRLARYRHDPDDSKGLGYGYVTSLLPEADGSIWVGVGGSGLYHLTAGQQDMKRYTRRAAEPTSLSDNYITALLRDDRGDLWVGTRSGGLNRFDRSTKHFQRFLPERDDERSISHHDVTSIVLGSDGALWIGTYGGGVNRLDLRSLDTGAVFDRLSKRDGLVDDTVVAILEDDDRSMWFATRNGISRYDPSTRTFVNYGLADGLNSMQFNRGAVARDSRTLYFGSTAGVAMIPRGTPFRAPIPSPTILTAVTRVRDAVEEEVVEWKQFHADRPQRIEAKYGDVLSFECAVLDFDPERRHDYAYRLSGAKDEWVELGSRREITFTNLDPGRYSLSFRGRNRHGVWSEPTPELAIHVVPPFWMTTWFEVLVGFSLVALALLAHRVRTSKLQRHNRDLLVLQKERETALRQVEASREELQNAYQRLRRLGRRLESAREDERQRIARELHDEMGQALTAAKINLQMRGGSGAQEEEPDEQTRDTIALLDGMIQRVRALSLDLRPPLLDELGLVAALRGYLEIQAGRAGIECEISSNEMPRDLPTEVEIAVFRGVQEAVTNVIRHAEAGLITVSLSYKNECVRVVVRDDGKGFDVEEALSQSLRGRHLGLLGMRERAESLNGRFDVISSPEAGTRVELSIPAQVSHEAPEKTP